MNFTIIFVVACLNHKPNNEFCKHLTFVATKCYYNCSYKRGVEDIKAKMGRPTDSPKNVMVRVRMDAEMIEMINKCSRTLRITVSEVVRQGVKKVYDGLEQK